MELVEDYLRMLIDSDVIKWWKYRMILGCKGSRYNLMSSYDENPGWFEDVNWSRCNQMNSYDENTGWF